MFHVFQYQHNAVLNPFGAGQAQPPPAYAALGGLGLYDSETGLPLEPHLGEDDESDSDDEDDDDDDMEVDYVPLPDLNGDRQAYALTTTAFHNAVGGHHAYDYDLASAPATPGAPRMMTKPLPDVDDDFFGHRERSGSVDTLPGYPGAGSGPPVYEDFVDANALGLDTDAGEVSELLTVEADATTIAGGSTTATTNAQHVVEERNFELNSSQSALL